MENEQDHEEVSVLVWVTPMRPFVLVVNKSNNDVTLQDATAWRVLWGLLKRALWCRLGAGRW